MSRNRWVLLTTLVTAVCTASGCALLLIGGGAAGYAYAKLKSEKSYAYSMDDTWSAVRDAVGFLGLVVISEGQDALSGKLEAQTADGEKVVITLEPKGPSVTKVQVRVGVLGNEERSQLILAKIGERLPDSTRVLR